MVSSGVITGTTIFFLALHAVHTEDYEDSTLSGRGPRISGRIVKLYPSARKGDFECTEEGFQADPDSCQLFYRCVPAGKGKFVTFRFQCGPGTVYDPDTNVCNHPSATKRPECHGSGSVSSSQAPATQAPPSNNVYGDNNENEIEHGQAPPKPLSSSEKPATQETTARTEIMTSSTSNPTNSTQISSQTTQASAANDECLSNGFIGDSKNCRKFYRCVPNGRGKFIRYEFSCSESTVWDQDVQACNHAWAVKNRRCGKGESENNVDNAEVSTTDQAPTPKVTAATSPPTVVQSQSQTNYGSGVSQSQTQINKGPSVSQSQSQVNYGDKVNQTQYQENKHAATSQSQSQANYGTQVTQSQTQINHSDDASQTQTQTNYGNRPPQNQSPNIQEDEENSESTTTRQPKEQNGNNQCSSSGFIGDSKDCKKFYRCVDNGRGGFIKYEFSCGEGTVWDPKVEACNHAWAVKSCGGKSPQSEANNTESTTQLTPQTTQEAPQTTKKTSSLPSSTTETDDDTGYGGQTTQKQTTSTKPTTQVERGDENNDNICTSTGFMGDSKDCKKFYRCVNNGKGSFTKYEFSCGEGTVWDTQAEACNHAWAVKKCGGKGGEDYNKLEQTTKKEETITSILTTTVSPPKQDTDNDGGYGQQEPSTAVTTQEPATSSTQAPHSGLSTGDTCTSSGFMGDSKDCKKFYRCVDNGRGSYTRYEFSCGEGTVWDPEAEACNHVWAVKKCGGKGGEEYNKVEQTTYIEKDTTTEALGSTSASPLQDEDDTGYNKPEIQPSTTLAPTTSTKQPTKEPEKDNVCTSSGFMGDTNDCKKFYRCVDNGKGSYTKYEFSCGEGTVWDSQSEACNHAWAVKSCGGKQSESQKVEETTTTSTTTAKSTTTDIDDYDQGYGEPSSTSAPLIETTSAATSLISTQECYKEGFVGDKKDCKKFYRCVDNGQGGYKKFEFTCGEGTVWDSEIDGCNHPSSVKNMCSGGESDTSASTETAVTSSNTNVENDEYPSEATSEASTQTERSTTEKIAEATQVTKLPSTDECSSEGFYGDSNDCKKFYRCVDNGKGGYNKFDFTCGEGTVWDQEIQGCNHEISGKGCSKDAKPPQSTEGATASTQDITTASSEYESTSEKTEHTASSTSANEVLSSTAGSRNICSGEGFYADENDCTKFYRCVDNGKGGYTKFEFTCGEGTVWDQEIQGCNHPSSNSCETKGTTVPQSSSSTTQLTSNTEPSNTASGEHTESSQSSDQTIPEQQQDEYPTQTESSSSSESEGCSSEGFFANKRDCKKFYRCVDNGKGGFTKYDFSCGDGTAWDNDVQACNHEGEVASCKNKESDDSSPPETAQDESVTESSQSTEKSSTASSQTTESSQSTQSEGSPSSQSTSTTSHSCSSSDTCTEEGFFGNSQNCKKFYRCVDNGKGGFTKYDFDCGEGTVWDQDVQTCNHPNDENTKNCNSNNKSDESSCSGPPPSESTTESGMSTSNSSGDASSGTSSTTTTQTSGSAQESSSKKPSNISCPEAGFYANPDDCKKFYRCVDWDGDGKKMSVFHFDCGEGTIWDPALETCNYEDSVYPPRDCSSNQAASVDQTEANSETTTTESSQDETTTEAQETTTQAQETTTQAEETTTQKQTTEAQESTTQEKTTQTQETTTQAQETTTQAQETTTQAQETTTQAQETTTQAQETTTQQSTTQAQETTTQEQTTTTEQETTTQVQETTTQDSTTQEQTTQESTTQSQKETTTQESTTESQTESTTESQSSTTESSTESAGSDKECPETDDDQYLYVCPTGFRRHPKYCNMFYQCSEDNDSHELKVAVFNCPNNTIYDESKSKCVAEEEADKKCNGEIAQKRRLRVMGLGDDSVSPVNMGQAELSCSAAGHYPINKKNECSPAFLKCEKSKKSSNLRAYIYTCPEGYVYWYVSRRCEKLEKIQACNGVEMNSWYSRSGIPVENMNVA